MAVSKRTLVNHDRHLPVGQVAANTLRTRLAAVWAELNAAVRQPDDVEHVHQLRVATRRTLAAVDAFRPVIPRKRRVWFERRLRRLRRAAGEARDLDVLAGRLSTNGVGVARRRLMEMLAKQRHDSRSPIRVQLDTLLESGWSARVDRLLADLRIRRPRSRFCSFARRRFKPMVASFFKRADRDRLGEDDIHALRIAGKKLRYALEIFGTVFPARDRIQCEQSLERLQNKLGECTDRASAAERFDRLSHDAEAGPARDMLVALRDDEIERSVRARRIFSTWWNPGRRRSLRRRLRRTLRRSA